MVIEVVLMIELTSVWFLNHLLGSIVIYLCLFFFFQAEDGIRDGTVTGVQTCALPIWKRPDVRRRDLNPLRRRREQRVDAAGGADAVILERDQQLRALTRLDHAVVVARILDRKSTRLNSSHSSISYAVFCLKKKKKE